jgi:cytochrome c biogenesis protein ResB
VNTFKQVITARRISLGLILLIAGLIYVSTLIPQYIDSTPGQIEAWRVGHPGILWLVDGARLHRIHGHPWFAAAILLSALAMGISSFDQLVLARKRLRAIGNATGEEVAAAVPEQLLYAVAREHRYRLLQTGSRDQLKFVRNPWGHFGSLLLHLGMTLVIIASLYVSLTGRQGALILGEGEQRSPRDPWDIAEHGALSAPLELPGTIRLDRVRVRFGTRNQPEEVSSDLTITDKTGRIDTLTASINRIPSYRGLRIYHASQYGTAFVVEFTDRIGKTHRERILAQQPVDLTTAGYSESFGVSWSPYLFAAKYYADAEQKSMLNGTPQLTIRMLDGTREVGRTVVPPGRTMPLGGYRLRLVGTEKWAKLIVVDNRGMPVIFTGFAIIMLGGLLHYLLPPRELIAILRQDGTYRVRWKALSFADFFAEERDMLATQLQEEQG